MRINGSTTGPGARIAPPPASLTKLMTALLVTDDFHQPQAVVRDQRAPTRESGMAQTRRRALPASADLLGAALLDSDNDACLALAEHLAGARRASSSA